MERVWGCGRCARQSLALVLLATACAGRIGTDEVRAEVPRGFYASAANVCKLLTTADLANVLGSTYSSGARAPVIPPVAFGDAAGITTCIYLPTGRTTFVATGVVYAYSADVFNQVLDNRQTVGAHLVKGIGERAFWDPQFAELFVLEKGKLFALFAGRKQTFESNAEFLARHKRLATIAMGRYR